MARMILQVPGEDVTLGTPGQQDSVFGTVGGDEIITVMSGGHVTFDASFGRGGDTIRLPGPADSYSVTLSGSRMILTGADGTVVNLPLGALANLLVFDGGDARPVAVRDGRAMVGDQPVADGDRLAPPPAGPDTQAPDAPEDVAVSADGERLSGRGEPGAEVRIDHDRDGATDQVGTVGSDGRFDIVLDAPLTNGERVAVRLADAAGNVSAPARVVAPDLEPAPDAPQVNASNGTVLLGTAEPGVLVLVSLAGGARLAEVRADDDGFWTFSPVPPLAHDVAVDVVAVGADGEHSVATRVVIDAIAPAAPVIEPSRGDELSGTAEPGVMIMVRRGGELIRQALVDGNGAWTITFETPLRHDANVSVIARDAALNTSPVVQVRIDAQAMVTIAPSNGAEISGTADAGSTVRLVDGSGNPIGQVSADGNGDWSFTPVTPLPHGMTVKATATDPLDNVSAQASMVIDAVAPPAPVVDPSNGSEISGTAEPASTVILTDGSGNPIGQVSADGNGDWSFTPGTPLPDGTVINAVARDAAGNIGPQGTTIVDAIAPAAPTIALSNGSSLSGTAEPDSTVVLTDGAGNPIAEVVADGVGNWTYVPASPLADGAIVHAAARDAAGNVGPQASVTIDGLAPAAPVINPSNGTAIGGTAEPDSIVTLTDGNGNPIGQVAADGSGNWSFTPGAPLANGTVIVATATDATGNVSAPATTTIDSVAPAAPMVDPSNGSEISGTAEPASTVILTDGSGNPIGETTADGAGNWSFTPGTPLPDGTVVNAVARDAAGNTGPQGSTTVDGVAPATPTVNLSNGSSLSGTAEPNSRVVLTDGNGNPIAEVGADGSGNWTYAPGNPLPHGTVVNVVARDAAGNASPPASVTVDSIGPAAPVIDPSNGVTISGTAEPGSTVTLTDGGGNPIGQVSADGGSNWSFMPGTPLANGTVIMARATDPTGNTGAQATRTVDAVAPPAPVVDPSNGSEISGTAEPDSKVILTDGGGNPIGETTADGSGNWSFTPGTPLANGTVVNAVAQDAAGNTGPQGSTTVDGIAPAAPVINPSNGNVVNGTAEPNSRIALTDGNGNPIGETTTDGAGNWSFTPGSQLPNGTVVRATATDAVGNVSSPGTATIDTSLPSIPQVDPSNGSVISGTADAGNTIIITDGNGNPIGQVTADGSGNWSFTPGIPLPDGTVVNVVARSPSNVDSAPAVTTIDGVAPPAPTVEPSDGSEIGGTAEPHSRVILTDGNGNPIGQTSADGDGDWSFTPGSALPHGTVINAVAQDPAGNTSGPRSITVDAMAPAAPTIDPSHGTVIAGSAEPDSAITLTDGSGNPIGQVIADGSGRWSYTPASRLPDGTVINATARDAAGNVSAPGSTIVTSVVNLDDVANGLGGFKIVGEAMNDTAGKSVAGAGDLDGDGKADLIIGASRNAAGGSSAGAGYVVLGGAANPVALGDVASGDGGFKITGETAGDGAGISVSGVGDFNGDGKLDLLIGAYQNDAGGGNAGAVYMVYGTGTLPAAVNLDDIAAGTGGFRLAGNAAGNWAGFSVSAAGDVNNDGRDDFIVGVSGDAAGGSLAGAAYVIFGSASPPGAADLGTVANGAGGFKIVGQNAGDHAGWSVSGAGDVNGDGYDDVIVGAYGNNQGGMFGGAAYVVYGGATPPSSIDLDAVAAGNGGFKIFAENASDSNAPGGFNAGNHISVSDAGDVNGDGYDDVIVGLYGNDAGGSNAGAAYVVFGAATNNILNLDNLAGANPGSRGFKIIGEASDDWAGVSVSAAGDVNNDGFDDVIVGADGNDADGNNAGAAYVIFGSDQPATVDLDDVVTGIGGFKIIGQNASDWAGRSVSAAGDVNGDGYDDLFVGAEGNDAPFPDMGAGYVIYGSDWPI